MAETNNTKKKPGFIFSLVLMIVLCTVVIAPYVLWRTNMAATFFLSYLFEAIDTVRLMQSKGMLVVASGRAGGVYEDPNAELAIALGLPLMKTGAPRSGERVAFTNTGLRVEEKLTGNRTMADPLSIAGFERLKNM